MIHFSPGFDQVRESMVANGLRGDDADRVLRISADAAHQALADFFKNIDATEDRLWPNAYLLGLQMLTALAHRHANDFKSNAAALGFGEVIVTDHDAPPHAA